MESHLEDFLVKNWEHTSLGREFDIYTDEDGELAGQQLQTDTGPLDILAVSKDKKIQYQEHHVIHIITSISQFCEAPP